MSDQAADAKTALEQAAYAYHENPQPGKVRMMPAKPCNTQDDLSLAYTPGVAFPCTAIRKDP